VRISYKLIGSFTALIALSVGLGIYSFWSGEEIERRFETAKQQAAATVSDATALHESVLQTQLQAYRLLSAGDSTTAETQPETLESGLDHHLQELDRIIERNMRTSNSRVEISDHGLSRSQGEEPELIIQMLHSLRQHRQLLGQLPGIAGENQQDARRFLDNRILANYEENVLPLLRRYQRSTETEFSRQLNSIERQLYADRLRIAITCLATVVIAILLGGWISYSLIGPLEKLRHGAEQVGKGRFDHRVPVQSNDELGTLAAAFNQMGEELHATVVSRDQLEASLREKEVLLREVHHRVKNNLQIIVSLLSLQSSRAQAPEVRELLGKSQDRVWAMARIHELLHSSDDLGHIAMEQYVRELCSHLILAGKFETDEPQVSFRIDPVRLPLDVAIPCGMILNELISNAFQHAKVEPPGKLQVQVTYRAEGDRQTFGVTDNGQADLKTLTENDSSLGLKIVKALVGQLKGELTVQADDGISYMVTFPAPPGK